MFRVSRLTQVHLGELRHIKIHVGSDESTKASEGRIEQNAAFR